MDFGFDNELDTVTRANTGVAVPLLNLDGSPLLNVKKEPVSLTLNGSDGEAYRKASRDLARKRVERSQKLQGATVPDDQLDAAQDDQLDLLVACTVGWSGVVDSKGEPVKATPAAVKEFYTRYPVVREQADRAIMDRALFIKASSGA